MHLVAVWAVDLSVLATVDLCAVQGPAADQAAEAASAEERDTLLSLYSPLCCETHLWKRPPEVVTFSAVYTLLPHLQIM